MTQLQKEMQKRYQVCLANTNQVLSQTNNLAAAEAMLLVAQKEYRYLKIIDTKHHKTLYNLS